jgi:glycosidase
MLEHFKKIIKLRKENSAMRSYNIEKIEIGDSRIFGYIKSDANEKIAVLYNLESVPVEVEKSKILKNKTVYDLYNAKEITKDKITIEGNGFLIIK